MLADTSRATRQDGAVMTGLCNVVLLACVLPAGSLLGAAPRRRGACCVAAVREIALRVAAADAQCPLRCSTHHSNGPARSLKKKAAGRRRRRRR